MTSPYLSPSSSSDPRSRTDSIFPIHLQDTGGIRKRSNSRSSRTRSISSANIERHPELLPDQIQDRLNLNSNGWTAAKHSPQPQHQSTSLSSSSNAPTLQPASETLTLPGFQSLQNSYTRFGSAPRDHKETPHTTSADMASLSYLPPPHYGHMAFQDPSFDHNYQQSESHSHIHPSSNFGFIFGTSAPSQQSIYASGPLDIEPSFSAAPLEPSLNHVSEPTSMNNLNRAVSPFHPSNYDSLEYPLASSTSRSMVNRSISHSPLSQHMDPLTPPLTAGLDPVQPQLAGSPGAQASMDRMRSPSIYDGQSYSSSYAAPGVQSTQPLFPAPQSYSYPPPSAISARQQVPRKSSDSQSRGVVNQKAKPQCWEHGCNGREFSTFSNLLRHQREKSGTAAKSYCPKCGAEFTRTTARNGHLAHEKCSKQRRTSEAK